MSMTTGSPTPPRCHWCGGETEIGHIDGRAWISCRNDKCGALGPFAKTDALAVAAYQAVTPALRWTSEPPKGSDSGNLWWCRNTKHRIEAHIVSDHITRGDTPVPGEGWEYAGPIPEPVEEDHTS